MKKYKHLTEKEFNKIKKYMEVGIKGKMLYDLTERTSATLSYVRGVKTFADYQNLYKKTQKNHPVLPKVRTEAKDDLVTILSEINQTLKSLVQAWENKPKRSLF